MFLGVRTEESFNGVKGCETLNRGCSRDAMGSLHRRVCSSSLVSMSAVTEPRDGYRFLEAKKYILLGPLGCIWLSSADCKSVRVAQMHTR